MNSKQSDFTRPAWSRAEAVTVFALVTLLVAFLIPMPDILLDILWGFTFCLAGAAIIICLGAQSSSDLAGFVPVVSGLVLLRLVVLASSARRIIEEQSTGILINCFGTLMAGNRPLGAVLLCLLLAVICVIVIFTSCQKITAASKNYLQHILPLKKLGLETDLQMGILNETNSTTLFQRIVSEFRFFTGMNGTSVLMRSESAICIFILLTCLIVPIFTEHQQFVSGAEFIAKAAPAVLALSLFTLLPGLIVATACGNLMSKEMLTLRVDETGERRPAARKITLISGETGTEEEVELLNPEFIEHQDVDSRIVEFEASPEPASPDPMQSLPEPVQTDLEWDTVDLSCQTVSDYYEHLCNIICERDSDPCVALLASDTGQSLPATVAVNVAILLARQQRRILLVDTDTRRNAIAQIFELDPTALQNAVMPSCLEMLSIHSVPATDLNTFLEDPDVAARFDTTLIYTPDASELTTPAASPAVRPEVFYFARNHHCPLELPETARFNFGSRLTAVCDMQSAMEDASVRTAG